MAVETKQVMKIHPVSLGKFTGAGFALVQFVLALVAIIATAMSWKPDVFAPWTGATLTAAGIIGTLIIVPIVAYVLGWVVGVIYASIYNAIASASGGGVKIDLG